MEIIKSKFFLQLKMIRSRR